MQKQTMIMEIVISAPIKIISRAADFYSKCVEEFAGNVSFIVGRYSFFILRLQTRQEASLLALQRHVTPMKFYF